MWERLCGQNPNPSKELLPWFLSSKITIICFSLHPLGFSIVKEFLEQVPNSLITCFSPCLCLVSRFIPLSPLLIYYSHINLFLSSVRPEQANSFSGLCTHFPLSLHFMQLPPSLFAGFSSNLIFFREAFSDFHT